jgi:hypothetical protein
VLQAAAQIIADLINVRCSDVRRRRVFAAGKRQDAEFGVLASPLGRIIIKRFSGEPAHELALYCLLSPVGGNDLH